MTAKTFKFGARSEGNLAQVHPDLVRVMRRALQISPLDFVVIEGVRTLARQRKLLAAGATTTLKSRHLAHPDDGLSRAVDIAPIEPGGKVAFHWPLYHRLAAAVKAAAVAENVAIVWGADWKSFKDGPHFELDRRSYP